MCQDSTTVIMNHHLIADDYNRTVIKTEVEEVGEHYDSDAKFILSVPKGSNMGGIEGNLMDVKLETGSIQENEKLLLANNSNLERSIHSVRFNESMIKAEKAFNADEKPIHEQNFNNIKKDTTDEGGYEIFIKTEEKATEENYDRNENYFVYPTHKIDIKHESEAKQEDENEEFISANKYKVDMETYDEFYKTDASYVYFDEESNQSKKTAEQNYNQQSELGTSSAKQAKSNKLFVCDKGDYVTNYISSLKKHMLRKHSEDRPFKCDKCDYRAKVIFELQQHQMKHTDERPFKCDACSYQAKTRSLLKLHRYRHTQDRPFKCDKCHHSAKNEKDLRRHQKRHTKIGTFHCQRCDYFTENNTGLNMDQIMSKTSNYLFMCDKCGDDMTYDKKNIDQVQTYKCDLCVYTSLNRGNFQKHQARHKNKSNDVRTFSCTKCNFVTKYGHSLKDHLLTHLEPTFQCDQCNYKARILVNLRKHQLRHKNISDVETFKCYLCDYITKRKQNLKTHIMNHK